MRRIWLCADDYGISPGVSLAIRDLIVRGRLNATSVMVLAPACDQSEARALNSLNSVTRRVAIGLHVTLTAPFRPLSPDFRPRCEGTFMPLGLTVRDAFLHRLDPNALDAELDAQFRKFNELFDRPPDYIDGHHHVQLLPQVRNAVLAVTRQRAPNAWVRQCGGGVALINKVGDYKAFFLDVLSRSFRRRASARGLRTNPAFAGTYDFREDADFAALFPRFLKRLPEGSVVMCHPGFVDAQLQRLDPLTTLREREYAFLAGDGFPHMLATHGIELLPVV